MSQAEDTPETIDASISGLHGIACGLVCMADVLAPGAVADHLVHLGGLRGNSAAQTRAMARSWLEQCEQALARPECDFDLLLPDEDEPLVTRLRALAAWCDGFLAGAGTAGDSAGSDTDATVLRDISAIAQVDDEGGSEEEEWQFMEIREYVRVAVLSMYLDRRGGPTDNLPRPPDRERLH